MISHDTQAAVLGAANGPGPIEADTRPSGFLVELRRRAEGLIRDVVTGTDERARSQRNAVAAFSIRVASAGLLYLTQILLARWMGGYEYGIYVFVWTWVLVLGGLSPLGLNMVVIRMVPEYRETGDLARLRGLTRGCNLLILGVGSAVALVGIAGLWLLQDYVASYYLLPGYLALVCVPLYALGDLQDGFGRGHGWMSVALVPPYILRPLMVLIAMVIAHDAGLEMSATTAAGAAILATWASATLQAVLISWRTATAASVSGEPARYDFQRWLTTSAPLFVIAACELMLQNADVLIVSTYLSPTEVGVYFAAAKTMSLIMFVHYAVGSAVANRFSTLNARGDKAALAACARDAVHWTFWPSLAAALVILALGHPLLWLFGPQFVSGYPLMLILVVGFLVRSAMGPAEFLLNMLGEQTRCAAAMVATAASNIALNLILVPHFGLTGAAAATTASLILLSVLQYQVVRRRLGLDIAIWRVWKRS
jgi:O-antigen/teichoic acid export membrane protein